MASKTSLTKWRSVAHHDRGIVDYLLHHCEPVQELKDAIADMTVADVARTLYGTARAALARLRSSQDFNEYIWVPVCAIEPDSDIVVNSEGGQDHAARAPVS